MEKHAAGINDKLHTQDSHCVLLRAYFLCSMCSSGPRCYITSHEVTVLVPLLDYITGFSLVTTIYYELGHNHPHHAQDEAATDAVTSDI